jgi:hypothetical protein
VASERQIAANRSNARRSTGARSKAGKTRARRNACRHGLCSSISSSAAFAKELEQLARKIAGDTKDQLILQHALTIAQAELELTRVRRAKVALIQRVCAFGTLDTGDVLIVEGLALKPLQVLKILAGGRITNLQPWIDPAATLPNQEPDRTAEAIHRALPEFLKLGRYERRASSRRHKAVMAFIGRRWRRCHLSSKF